MELRPYQKTATTQTLNYFEQGHQGHPLIVMPTGSGKSLVIAEIVRHIVTQWPGSRIVMLTHVKELIQQNLNKLLRLWPQAPVGVYSAGLNSYDTNALISFCGIQSVWNKAKAISSPSRPIELVLIDEVHRVPLHPEGTYRTFIADLMAMNPHLRVIGLTASPYRYIPRTSDKSGGYQYLTVGDDRLLTDCVYDLSSSIPDLIQQNYLAPLWPAATCYQVNTDGIATRHGDFAENELEAILTETSVVNQVLDEAIALATQDHRKHWLVFCVNVNHAQVVFSELKQRGISVGIVTGKTSDKERDQTIQSFQAGRLTALVSVGVLTVGFDAPITDCIIMVRPTQSPILYTQIMGRGFRPTPEKIAIDSNGRKRGCLVLDFCGNVERHGPIDDLRIKTPKAIKEKEEPTKECPQCHKRILIFAKRCPECEYEFLPNKQETPEQHASQAPVIVGIIPPTRYPVHRVLMSPYQGKSGFNTLRVDYYSGMLRIASEWVCLEHPVGSFPRRKAEQWWYRRSDQPAPLTIEGALKAPPDRKPSTIYVKNIPGKRFVEIVKTEF